MSSNKVLSVLIAVIVVAGLVLWYAASVPKQVQAAKPLGTVVKIAAPLGLPDVPYPADNPPTAETIVLGRRLFYDPVLSVDRKVACATCHSPEHGFADGERVSTGVMKETGTRNAPTVFNCAYYEAQFWDGRAPSLEKQAEGPVQNPVEMAHTLAGVEQRLNADATYRAEFSRAFGAGPITYEMVEKAIASFERTVISGGSPFDRWYFGHEKKALTAAAQRGFEVFRDSKKGNCAACHTVGENNAMFTDNKFHNIGIGENSEKVADEGRFAVTKNPGDLGGFKTPSLRNVALTGPYFHDGSRETLKDAIDYYIGGGNSNPNLDAQIHPLTFLTARERSDLLEFLNSLTGEMPANTSDPKQREAQR